MENVSQILFDEERTRLVPIGINLKCGICHDGYLEYLEPSGPQISSGISTYPIPAPTYYHECTNDECLNQGYFDRMYPGIEYEVEEYHEESVT